MTTATLTVDQLTDKVLDTIDTCRYRPDRATLRIQFMLRGNDLNPAGGPRILRGLVMPALAMLHKGDAYNADPVWAVEQWDDHVPNDQILSWARQRADELRWDVHQLVHDYLAPLLEAAQ